MIIEATGVDDFEIVFGLVARIGTRLDEVISCLSNKLREFRYETESIRLSHLLDRDPTGADTNEYYWQRMNAGDALREKHGTGDAVAALGVTRMSELRGSASMERRHAWILRTLKHEEEVRLLRHTYGSRFILLGIYETPLARMRDLTRHLRDSGGEHTVEELIRRDEADQENELGQQSRDTFAAADYFIDMTKDVSAEVERMLSLVFGVPFHTPTRDEVAMFHAYGASLRSSDPGRQVGAAITTATGELIATGTNEVPTPGGGEYWTGDDPDRRDFREGYDFNRRLIHITVKELLARLATNGMLADEIAQLNEDQRVDNLRHVLKGTRAFSLIEFGRIVHAEMSAITTAARLGISISGSTLFTTDYPCHMCMRLVIASGIRRVVFVGPYPKSLAADMYGPSIAEERARNDAVLVEPYRGSSWSLYTQLFTAVHRDRDPRGTFTPPQKGTLRLRLAGKDPLLDAQQLEDAVVLALVGGDAVSEPPTKTTTKPKSRTKGKKTK